MHFSVMCDTISIYLMKGMTSMKKIVAIILMLTLVLGVCSVTASGENGITDLPLVIVPGYSSADLFLGDDPDTGEKVWHLDMNKALDLVVEKAAELGIGIGALTAGNAEVLAKSVGKVFQDRFECMRCEFDGSSAYEICYYDKAAETNNAALRAKFSDNYLIHEVDFNAMFAKHLPDDFIFNFNCDWRMGAESCATELDTYIQQVKELTGKDKVNIYAISHGGQVAATYLNLFGYKNDVDNAVITVPAINGAGIAYDLAVGKVKLNEEQLIRFIEQGFNSEEDFEWLVKAQQLGFLDDVLNSLVPYAMPILRTWGSILDFMPADKYEEVKQVLFDRGEGEGLIEISDRYHYEILPVMGEKLRACVDNGMNISIIMGYGEQIISGMQRHSDAIILTEGATGATCAPLGKRFADGYVQAKDCGGKNKVSPGMDIDASTAYLPDNTWFIKGMFHGMMHPTMYSRELVVTLAISDKITDVYSDPNYPQFIDSTSISQSVYAKFNNSTPGYISSQTNALTVTNVGQVSPLKILAVTCNELDIEFDVGSSLEIAPGESVDIPFTGTIPSESKTVANVTVYYKTENLAPLNYRTQAFTLDRGDAVDRTLGFAEADRVTAFDKAVSYYTVTVLEKLGLREVFTLLYGIVSCWLNSIV